MHAIKFTGFNHDGYSLTGHQVLSLLPIDYRFKSYKPHDYWRLIRLLASGPVRLIEVHAS
jgi:hypothetical protein